MEFSPKYFSAGQRASVGPLGMAVTSRSPVVHTGSGPAGAILRSWPSWSPIRGPCTQSAANAPVEPDAIRAVIAEVLTPLPPGAAEVRERRGHLRARGRRCLGH